MNFEEFREDLENKLNSICDFELQEFMYAPYSMGYGHVAYRIKGLIHKFEYEPRDQILTWYKSKPHQKYSGAELSVYRSVSGLNLAIEDLKTGI